jgi:hypothetical protein
MLIKQRNDADCGICCLAMILTIAVTDECVVAKTYDRVKETIGDAWSERNGLTNLAAALDRLGFVTDSPYRGQREPNTIILTKEPGDNAKAFHMHSWGRPSLIVVPTLNHPPGWHMVVHTGYEVLDPSNERTYKKWDELVNCETIAIFRTSM